MGECMVPAKSAPDRYLEEAIGVRCVHKQIRDVAALFPPVVIERAHRIMNLGRR